MTENIEKRTMKYTLLRVYVNIFHKFYYKRFKVVGTENIPQNKPVIIAPNHQNALMDALAFSRWKNIQQVWLARADIFNKKTTGILTTMKILPIYRMRDGMSQLGKNEKIFDAAVRMLKSNKILSLFPEATHNDKRQLLPVKKGVQRIAFIAQERTDYQLDLQIVPVGLYYSNYYNFNKELLIVFGKPIEQKKYNDLYKENNQKAFNELGKEIARCLDEVAVNIPSKENYEIYELVHNILPEKAFDKVPAEDNKLLRKVKAFKYIDKKLYEKETDNPDFFNGLKDKILEYNAELKKWKIRDFIVKRKSITFLELILRFIFIISTFPFYLIGLLFNGIPFIIPDKKVKKIQKDPQFISSFNFVLALIVFPLFYLIMAMILSIVFGTFWLMFSVFIMPVLGMAAFRWSVFFKKTYSLLKVKFNKDKFNRLKVMRDNIVRSIENIL